MSTRDQIVEGAFAALLRHGLPNMSFDRIAQMAGTSRQLVRYHFKDHDTLMLAVCARLEAEYKDAIRSCLALPTGDRSRLDLILDFHFDLVGAVPKPADERVYDALMSRAAESAPVREALRRQSVALGRFVSDAVAREHPSLGADRCDEIAYVFVATMYGHWKLVRTLGLSERHREVARDALDRIIASHLATADAPAAGGIWELQPQAHDARPARA
ncbi:TetR/AcrR family transcriptional regulator [Jannaschia sp. LMIT008]|uniref:TetR/AcrR family transcriptional regulator n=1 Tax=Jannaschia maritima TaxID=3032585 RepID=UPI0028119331|nr:TetR family transcriptional regulator [Jannaschia sp. LMIT008]